MMTAAYTPAKEKTENPACFQHIVQLYQALCGDNTSMSNLHNCEGTINAERYVYKCLSTL